MSVFSLIVLRPCPSYPMEGSFSKRWASAIAAAALVKPLVNFDESIFLGSFVLHFFTVPFQGFFLCMGIILLVFGVPAGLLVSRFHRFFQGKIMQENQRPEVFSWAHFLKASLIFVPIWCLVFLIASLKSNYFPSLGQIMFHFGVCRRIECSRRHQCSTPVKPEDITESDGVPVKLCNPIFVT
jgi:hypothetical protein